MEEDDEELTNKFVNDGSFFEKFRKMQEQQKEAVTLKREPGSAGVLPLAKRLKLKG